MSPLKTNAHDSRFEFSNLLLFLSIRSTNADKCTVLGCHNHDLNTDRKWRFFNFRKGTILLLSLLCILQTAHLWANTGVVERELSFSRLECGVLDKLHISSADWWDLLLPLAETPDRRDQRLLVSPPKDTEINNL